MLTALPMLYGSHKTKGNGSAQCHAIHPATNTKGDDMKEEEEGFIKHAALIWQQDGCTVMEARQKAWEEGPAGYGERLERQFERELYDDAG